MKTKITPKSIKSICNKVVLYRGKRFYADNKENIRNFKTDGNKISAVVNDNLDCNVKIDISTMKYGCSCNYGRDEVCKHIIAVLYMAIEKEKNSNNLHEDDAFEELKSAIKNVDRNSLELFIINEAVLNEGVQNRALNFFKSGEHKQTLSFYKKEVNKFLKSLIHDYYVPVSRSGELITFIDNIELIAKRGSIEEAIKYYRAAFEVLEAKLKTLDDSYGVIQDAIRLALNKYIEYSNGYYTKQEDRNNIIQYLWKQFIKYSDIDYYYTDAISAFCDNDKDWEYYKNILSGAIAFQHNDKDNYMLQTMVEAYIDVLIRLNNRKEIEKVFEKFSNISGSITYKKIEYLWSIEQFENAIMIFESSIDKLYHRDIDNFRAKISDYLYKTDRKKYLNNLIALYNSSPSYEMYKKIEKGSGDFWKNIKDELYDKIKKSPELVDVYIKKGLMKEAFLKLAEIDRTELYDKHLEILSPLFPDEYFDHYKNAIIRDFKESMYPNRKLYRSTLMKIRNLSIIKGAEGRYVALLEQLKEENKIRPAFLDEMKKILE